MSPGVYRRRRLLALLAAVLVAGAAAGIIVAVSSGGSSPHYVPAGARAVTTPAPTVPAGRSSAPAFRPAPAAIRSANAMPLATRVAQLFLVTVSGSGVPGGEPPWGGVVLTRAAGAADPAGLLAGLRALPAPRGSRALIAADQPGGTDNALPQLPPLSQAVLADRGVPAAAGAQAAAAGTQLRARGIRMTLAPAADVDITGGALSGRLFSTDPQTVARFTAAALAGYARTGVIPAVGHFPGQGSASADPDTATAPATVGGSLASLRASDLVPFTAVASRAPVIEMSNAVYAAFDGVTPASLLPAAVGLLRGELHFTGVVMSGDLDATLDVPGSTPGQAALAALRAGDDLLYIGGPPSEHVAAYAGVLAAARRSSGLRDQIRQALLRDLTLKARYGLLR